MYAHSLNHVDMENWLQSTSQALRKLTSKDLPTLVNELNPVASKCYALGLQLGVHYEQLCTIEYNYRKCEDQLREIIAVRLNQEPPLTWCDVAKALRADSMKKNKLASDIEDRYVNNQPPLAQANQPPLAEGYSGCDSDTRESRPPAAKQRRVESTTLSDTCSTTVIRQPTSQSHNISEFHVAHPLIDPLESPVEAFINHVKTLYRSRSVERNTTVVKWPPTPSEVYINLAWINRQSNSAKSKNYTEVTEAMIRDGNVDVILNATKGPIDFADIAKNISIGRRLILVEGAPGVGKSTFEWEFCRKWERGEIAHQYRLVLLLRLRDEIISKAKSLKDLVYHPFEGVAQAVCTELVQSHDLSALIILEGFDELPDSCRNDQSIFMQLISGKLLPLATVLITSRPWATRVIRQNYGNLISQHIEILGFTSDQITRYIESTLPQDEASDLNAYLERHPQIRSGMYIPLNSAIVVTVYQESQETGCALPN